MFLNWCWKRLAALTGRPHSDELQREHLRVRRPVFDSLEDRCMMTATTSKPLVHALLLPHPTPLISPLTKTKIITPAVKGTTTGSSGTAHTTSADQAHTTFVRFKPSNNGSPTPFLTSFTPAQIQQAYCINEIRFGNIVGDGKGQTIAIVDAYDNPAFVNSTDPNFNNSDLHQFDLQFGLPDPPSFTKLDQNGGMVYPPVDPAGPGNANFETEEALDVEWAHAIAPQANIVLIEADDATTANLIGAGVAEARSLPNVSVVSMSFGLPENVDPALGIDSPTEQSLDPLFTTPAGHIGMTFLASSGDSGAPGGYPAFSPNVVAVGGTTLTTDAAGNYISEVGWGNGVNSNVLGGSGGGPSQFEPQPAYQAGVVTQSTTQRTSPDVSFDADPNSGVAVYDSYNNVDGTGPWNQIGGTSLACPCWAGLIAIADQGRTRIGVGTLDGVKQTLPMLYKLPASDFHDILTGNNGFPAGPGYDLVTGIGTPNACDLIPDLVKSQINGIKLYYPLRFVYDPASGTYSGNMTFENTNPNTFMGTFTVVLPGLSPSITVVNGTTVGGQPAVVFDATLPGNSTVVRVALRLKNPSKVPLPTFFVNIPFEVMLS